MNQLVGVIRVDRPNGAFVTARLKRALLLDCILRPHHSRHQSLNKVDFATIRGTFIKIGARVIEHTARIPPRSTA